VTQIRSSLASGLRRTWPSPGQRIWHSCWCDTASRSRCGRRVWRPFPVLRLGASGPALLDGRFFGLMSMPLPSSVRRNSMTASTLTPVCSRMPRRAMFASLVFVPGSSCRQQVAQERGWDMSETITGRRYHDPGAQGQLVMRPRNAQLTDGDRRETASSEPLDMAKPLTPGGGVNGSEK
jgi:hypothetical protein